MNLNRIKTMGVINITPNSFSDGGKYNNSADFSHVFNQACSNFDIIDIGAESTAPFNEGITAEEELNRFREIFYPVLRDSEDNSLSISIDTYKPEVFHEVACEVLKHWPDTSLYFNDVSGVIDTDLIKLLESKLKFHYIYAHNLVEERSQTSKHMEYVSQEDIVNNMQNYFRDGLATLKSFNRKIIIDPCFGFSKTREQNHLVLKHIDEIFNGPNLQNELLIGISRKSFLRFPRELELNNIDNQKMLDCTQSLILNSIIEKNPQRDMIIRVHDLNSINAIKNTNSILA